LSRKLKPKPALSVARKQPPRWQRERNIARIAWTVTAITVAVVAALVGFWGYDNYVAAWHQPIADVNETSFNMDYYVKALRVYSLSTEVDASDASFPYQVLTTLENRELMRQRASDLGIAAAPEEVTEAIKGQLLPEPGAENSTQPEPDFEPVYQEWLDFLRFSDAEYRQFVEPDVLARKITEHFAASEVPDEAEHVHLHATARETQEAAIEALDLMIEGNVTLLQEISQSDLGWVPRGIYPEFDDVAFAIQPGNVTGPIPFQRGDESYYGIIMVSEVSEVMPITDDHRGILANSQFGAWLNQCRENSVIQEYLDQAKIQWAKAHA
jgi:hypothetical protein